MKDIQSEASANSPLVKTVGQPRLGEPNEDGVVILTHPALKDTGNGSTVSYEESLLQAYFGDPVDGVYGGCEE